MSFSIQWLSFGKMSIVSKVTDLVFSEIENCFFWCTIVNEKFVHFLKCNSTSLHNVVQNQWGHTDDTAYAEDFSTQRKLKRMQWIHPKQDPLQKPTHVHCQWNLHSLSGAILCHIYIRFTLEVPYSAMKRVQRQWNTSIYRYVVNTCN